MLAISEIESLQAKIKNVIFKNTRIKTLDQLKECIKSYEFNEFFKEYNLPTYISRLYQEFRSTLFTIDDINSEVDDRELCEALKTLYARHYHSWE